MVRKFELAFGRLDQNVDRIAAHLDKLAARGQDVTALRAKLEEAQNKITEAKQALEDAKKKYAEATNQDFKIAFARVKEVVAGVAEKVKAAHRALVDVVNSIKGANRQPAVSSGSTHVPTTSVPTPTSSSEVAP